ncbi:MAG TPA: ATP-binding protein, partial [Candidatus Limnocylindrales bacterium]|nr:ATP-binding protein [Candidatus Limnocylindrales bacterium]
NEMTARRLPSMRHFPATVPVMAFAIDREGRLAMVQANPAMAQRYSPWRYRGLHWSELGLPDTDRLGRTLMRVLGGEPVDLRLMADNALVDIRAWPTYDRESAIVGAFGVAVIRASGEPEMLSEHDSARLREILDHIEDGYYEVDLRGRFLVVNDAAARLLGLTRDELLGVSWPDYRETNSNEALLIENAFRDVYRTKEPLQAVEGQIRRPDGAERSIELSISPILNGRGRVTGFRGIVRDVTERKQADDDLAKRVALLAVLEQVDTELSQTLDLDNVLTIGMNALLLLSHADASEIVIRDERTDVFTLARHTGFDDAIELVPQSMGIIGRVLRQMKPDLTLDVAADPDYYAVRPATRAQITLPLIAHYRLLGVVSLETDDPARFTPEIFEFASLLTARVAAAIENARLYQLSQSQLAELRGLYEQVSALEQIKTDMIRIASHDLRSPLGIIVGYLDLLLYDLEPTLNAEQRGFFDAMKRAADRMQRMTTDILSLERVQTVRMQTHVRLNLESVVRKIVDDFEDNAAHKGVKIVRAFGDERVPIVGDPISLAEAIGNLIGNAIKYTPAGGRVEVRLNRERKAAEVLVIDNGIGIAEADQDKLFSPFYRIKSEETQGIEGTGLGLYLVRRIVEQHSGEMIFHSVHGEGSTFGFRVPLFVTSMLESPNS